MATVEVKNLVKRFGDDNVVDHLSFNVADGEIVALLGASGCGKTTTVRCIAGLESPTDGEIWVDGKLVASANSAVPPERRGIGMVFQSYAVWPHMTVYQNVAYGLRVKRMRKAKIQDAVLAALKLTKLDGLERRYPAQLSGGQQQRVALARSIAAEPTVLLLDEPLSNLDAKLREQMRDELRELVKRIGMTAIHITHDQVEAMAIADRIAVMSNGRIVQEGSGRDLYHRPNSRFVAEFFGATTFLEGVVSKVEDNRVLLSTSRGLDLWCARPQRVRERDLVAASVRPEHVELATASDQVNRWSVTVRGARFLGSIVECTIDLHGELLRAALPVDVESGQSVDVTIRPENIVVLAAPGVPEQKEQPGGEQSCASDSLVSHTGTASTF